MSDARELRQPPLRAASQRWAVSFSVLALLAVACAVPAHWARSGEPESKSPPTTAAASASLLDGRTFHGDILDDKEVARSKDVITFRDGKFYSVNCAELGFSESPYWIRTDGDTTHFLAEISSPTRGTLVVKGTIRGDNVEWRGSWTKERWYWTIRREFRFRGTEKK